MYSSLTTFLIAHNVKNFPGKKYTHTRIGSKKHEVFGGSYYIDGNDVEVFNRIYYDHVFNQRGKEYLTECQLDHAGSMAVDFDFRYGLDCTRRYHNNMHIEQIVTAYLELIHDCYTIPSDAEFNVYIFEKQSINNVTEPDCVKDGIHIIFALKIDYDVQLYIRTRIMDKMSTIIGDLPLINSMDKVLDYGISTGKTNWQLLGSQKPGHQRYELTYIYVAKMTADNSFRIIQKRMTEFNVAENFMKLSVRYEHNNAYPLRDGVAELIEVHSQSQSNKLSAAKKKKDATTTDDPTPSSTSEHASVYVPTNEIDMDELIGSIVDSHSLTSAVETLFMSLHISEYELQELHNYVQILPESYYMSGSHEKNIKVAYALKHTSNKLFLSWIMLRSKAENYDYGEIPEKYDKWKKLKSVNDTGSKFTKRSIIYWAKTEDPEKYSEIANDTIRHLVLHRLTATEYDIAYVLKQLYKSQYICVSNEKQGVWYQYKQHRWVLDKGRSLRSKLSEEFFMIISNIQDSVAADISKLNIDTEEGQKLKNILHAKVMNMSDICIKLKKTQDKNNIMREACDLFYDDDFIRMMDSNPYLLCFTNGVVDFKEKVFRNGSPEDYITKCTKHPYLPPDELKKKKTAPIVEQIHDLMNKLFPIEDQREYMWEHLASVLIGTNINQTCHMYLGSGSNGKSLLCTLVAAALGEYSGILPIQLLTDARPKLGGTSDEILQLIGLRWANAPEPSKGAQINDGVLKQLSCGDPVTCRGLYQSTITFQPQMTITICSNVLMEIKTNDDGLWRRIRLIHFMSKFVDDGEKYYDNTPYVFKKNKELYATLNTFAPVFLSMLVEIAYKTQGYVKECETVTSASLKYREGQDHIERFVNETIVQTKDNKDKLKKRQVYDEFKIWFMENQGSRKMPKGEELYELLNKRFGPCTPTGWKGLRFVQTDEKDHSDTE